MAAIQSRKPKVGSVVKMEFGREHGYERKDATVAVDATSVIGTVVKADGDGTYSTVVAADVATLPADIGIIVDDALYDSDTLGDRTLALLVGGPGASGGAIVKRDALAFGDALTSAQIDTVAAALEALGIKVA